MRILKEFPKFFPSQELFMYDGLVSSGYLDQYRIMKFLCESVKEVINSRPQVRLIDHCDEYTRLPKGMISFHFTYVKKKFGKVRLGYTINVSPPTEGMDHEDFILVTKEAVSRIKHTVSTIESLINFQ